MMKTIHVVAAIIKRDQDILIAKRGYGQFKGMYEFPGGKVEPHESQEEALKRELLEEMHVHIEVDYLYDHIHYEYPDFILEMDCYRCHLLDEHITLTEHLDYRWMNPSLSYDDIDIIPADISLFEKMKREGIE